MPHEGKGRQQFGTADQSLDDRIGDRLAILRQPAENAFEIDRGLFIEHKSHVARSRAKPRDPLAHFT